MAIGLPVNMIDARQRVMGTIDYTINIDLPGSLAARLVTSPHAHARIVSVDVAAARRIPGVRAIVTGPDLAGLGMQPLMGRAPHQRPVLAIDRVRFTGEPVVAVAAEDADAAEEAAALISVEYEELTAVIDIRAALEPDAAVLHGASNIAVEFHLATGDVEAGFAQADELFEDEFSTPAVQHVALEPHVCLAAFQGERLVVLSSTQNPFGLRDELATMLGVSRSRVRVVVPTLGGGFGSKLATFIEPIAVALARASGRPTKLILTRAQEFASFVRHPSRIHMKTGVMRDGTLVARQSLAHFSTGAYGTAGVNGIENGGIATASLYRIPNVRADGYAVYTNTVPGGAFRAPGAVQAVWASEMQMDRIARSLGIDPLELRRKNLVRDGDRFVAGGHIEDMHFDELLERAQADLGWSGPNLGNGASGARDASNPSRFRIGRSLLPTMKTTRTPATSNAALKLNGDGSVNLMTGAVEMGQGSRTALAQIAAHTLGVPYEAVAVAAVDTDVVPWESGTASSRTTFAVGNSVMRAGGDLLDQVRELAAEEFEVSPQDVLLEGGRASVMGVPDRNRSFGELITRSGRSDLRGEGHFVSHGAPDPVTGKPGLSAHWHHGAVGAEVEVDTETGRVEVTRMWAGVYAGRIVNPILCELQAHGSVLMGLGEALFEGAQYADGTLVTNSLAEYNIPSIRDAPTEFLTRILEEPESLDMHGVGETLVPPVCGAIGCAIADALGVALRDLPLTPERILLALRAGEALSASNPDHDLRSPQ